MANDTNGRAALDSPHVPIDRRKLRLLRQLKGLTQVQLGEASGLHGSYIGLLENGRRTTMGPPAFARLCDALTLQDRTELLASETADDGATPAEGGCNGSEPSEGAAK